jgi:2'-5' RNA ligase
MIRLFAGLELPQAHRLRLSLVRAPLPGAKWIEPDDMHITLRFAGDIARHAAEEFAGFLAEIDVPSFDLRIGELGSFGGNEPRIIYAAVHGGEALASLHRATERAARSAGLAPDRHAFKPHVTLARLKGTRPEQVACFLASRAPLLLPPFRVDRFVLFSSKPRVGGGPYVVEEAFDLAAR